MKLYACFESTWSLRAWICLHIAGIDFETRVLPLSGEGYKARLISTTRTGLVPALESEGILVSDSLAIAEYINEISKGALYPSEEKERSLARSLVCELHSGFLNLRKICPFSTGSVTPVRRSLEISLEIERVEEIFSKAQTEYLFSKPTVVDAFYSILAYRLHAYGIILSGKSGEYQSSLLKWSLLKQAIEVNAEWGRNA